MTEHEQGYKQIEHPVEQVLELQEGSTMVPTSEREGIELTVTEEYDDKDHEVERQFHEVYESAMTAFEQQQQDNEIIEPKYRARNQEVAVQYLNTALSAAREKANMKQHKDKLVQKSTKGPNTVNNNLVVADRNEVLKNLINEQDTNNTTESEE